MLTWLTHFLGFDKFFPSPYDIIFLIAVSIALFFALRELNTWYWKINEGIELLKKIEENTRNR